jgi:hypothetical protein
MVQPVELLLDIFPIIAANHSAGMHRPLHVIVLFPVPGLRKKKYSARLRRKTLRILWIISETEGAEPVLACADLAKTSTLSFMSSAYFLDHKMVTSQSPVILGMERM